MNEAAAIGSLVVEVRLQIPMVLVVDDGSNDGTREVAEAAGAKVLRHEVAHGKGAALQNGWRWARQSGFSWALSLDGDGQHCTQDIPAFLRCAERTSAALVVGNRMAMAARMPLMRRCVNRWMSHRLSKLTGQNLPDSQCGFRLMNLQVWAGLQIESQHFEIESEILLAFVETGHKVEFVPVRAIYKTEQSKIHPVRDSVRWFWWLRKARAHYGTKKNLISNPGLEPTGPGLAQPPGSTRSE